MEREEERDTTTQRNEEECPDGDDGDGDPHGNGTAASCRSHSKVLHGEDLVGLKSLPKESRVPLQED